ncbi:MAG: hypothetical protein L3J06_03610, partial [Cyclobacteriaceae bacterium]|nr:hypothetical protein [Cyclobacteriaceae bacterium]
LVVLDEIFIFRNSVMPEYQLVEKTENIAKRDFFDCVSFRSGLSFKRAIEVDENILRSTETLDKQPSRGYLEEAKEGFRFILHKETKHFEIKIIYYIDEIDDTVFITDFFPTKMDPQKISTNK